MKKNILITLLAITTSAITLCGCNTLVATQTSEITEGSVSETSGDISDEAIIEEDAEILATPQADKTPSSEATASEMTAEATSEPTAEPSPEVSPEPTPEAELTPAFLVSDYSATMYAKQNCNIRKGPGTEYDKAGSLSLNETVIVTGVTDNGWFRIDKTGEAYVSGSLLVADIIVAEVPAATPSTQPESQSESQSGIIEIVNTDPNNFFGVFCPGDNYCYCDTATLALVNEYRAAEGVPALTWNSGKETECKARAQAMKNNYKMDHKLDGGFAATGECLATGMTLSDGQQARAIVSQYVDDAPHYELLVSPSFTSMCCANCYDELGEFWNVLWFFR